MADAAIRETIVTPADASGGAVVQLRISDVPLADVSEATLHLSLSVSVPGFEAPLLAQLQRTAMTIARDTLSQLLQQLAQEIQGGGHDLNPTRKP